MARWMTAIALAVFTLLIAACGGDGDAGDIVYYDLTAEVVDWQVVDGEIVEVWGYNGEYPGPTLEAEVGETVQVRLTNNLPEGTSIHWHGMEVPNDQDGVPGITQPIIEPGESYVYQFTIDQEPGTTMYHTHANTMSQLGRGLVGPFIIHEKGAKTTPKYGADYTFVLHEIEGLYTINGHSFPEILSDPESVMSIETGDRILIRLINAGQQHHPMHMHGHQMKVVALDGAHLENPYEINTIDIAPGQTVDVEITGDNPGTWTFHCHIIGHVTNRGVYPGGMLTVLDYADHTSMLEGADAPTQPEWTGPTAQAPGDDQPETTTTTEAAQIDREIVVVSTEFAFDPDSLELQAGERIALTLVNEGAVIHNLEIPDMGVYVEAPAGATATVEFTVPDGIGAFDFWCSIAGHREAGMEGSGVAG